jgi:hypothetical protein
MTRSMDLRTSKLTDTIVIAVNNIRMCCSHAVIVVVEQVQ